MFEEEYVPISSEESANLSPKNKLALLKEAKMGSCYDDWKPYCMCPTMNRMVQYDYGFKCSSCGNMIGWDLYRLTDSPLNKIK